MFHSLFFVSQPPVAFLELICSSSNLVRLSYRSSTDSEVASASFSLCWTCLTSFADVVSLLVDFHIWCLVRSNCVYRIYPDEIRLLNYLLSPFNFLNPVSLTLDRGECGKTSWPVSRMKLFLHLELLWICWSTTLWRQTDSTGQIPVACFRIMVCFSFLARAGASQLAVFVYFVISLFV